MPDSSLQPSHSPRHSPSPWIPPGALGGRIQTALLVEDSRHAAEAVRQIARRLALRLRRAETIASARRHLSLYCPDFLLVDAGLPDGDGLELVRALRGPRPGPVPGRIVVISADPAPEAAALASGADAFVRKPFELPGDLGRLFGPEALAPLPPVEARPDPLALRDDLLCASAGIGAEGADLRYLSGFLAGIARCSGDQGLMQAVRRTESNGRTEALSRYLQRRAEGLPGL